MSKTTRRKRHRILGLVAAGSPTGIRDDAAANRVALAGPEILVARHEGRAAQLLAQPRAGGPARTLLTVGSAELSVKVRRRGG